MKRNDVLRATLVVVDLDRRPTMVGEPSPFAG